MKARTLRGWAVVVLVIPLAAGAHRCRASSSAFAPRLQNVALAFDEVRPGDRLAYALTFMNVGGGASSEDLHVFAHLEREGACAQAAVREEHRPLLRTIGWPRGEPVTDGPHLLAVPAERVEGIYAGVLERGHRPTEGAGGLDPDLLVTLDAVLRESARLAAWAHKLERDRWPLARLASKARARLRAWLRRPPPA